MRESQLILLLLFCSFVLLPSSDSYSQQPSRLFRAGAIAVDITPTQFPVISNGMFEQRMADGVVDRLMSRALVLDDGQTRLAIVVVDSLMIPRALLDEAKETASRATGIPTERILISATHTHSAPSAMGALGSDTDRAYAQFLPGQIAKSIVLAAENLVPARIGWTVVKDEQHSHCRRWIFRPDRVGPDPFGVHNVRAHMHPGHQSGNHIGPSGPADPDLSLLAVETADGTPLAVVGNYAMHYYGSGMVSADFCGRFGDKLAESIGATSSSPPFVGMMSQGTSGDAMWMDYSQPAPRRDIDKYTAAIAGEAAAAYGEIKFHDWVPLTMAETKLKLARRVPDADRLAWARKTYTDPLDTPSTGSLGRPKIYAREALLMHAEPEVELKLQAVRIGDLGITAIPNEVYAITGLKLKAQSPLATTFNIELANGAQGYIPPPEQHALGGYTTWPARTAGLEVDAEPKIVATLLTLLEQVAERKRQPIVDPPSNYSSKILAAKPHAYWRLDDMLPARAIDATENYDAEFEGGVAMYLPGVDGPEISAGRRGNRAVHFAGGHLQASLDKLGDEYSVSLWLWNGLPTDARPVTGALFSRGDQETLVIGGTAEPEAMGKLVFRGGDESFVGRSPLQTKGWHYVAITRARGKVSVYLDGNPKAEISASIKAPATDALMIRIACNGKADQSFEGKIDEVAVFNRLLTPEEIADHFESSAVTPPQPPRPKQIISTKPFDAESLRRYAEAVSKSKPVAFWRLHDDKQTSATDDLQAHPGEFEAGANLYQPGDDDGNFEGGRVKVNLPSIANKYSIEFWFRNELSHHSRPVTGYMFSRGEDGSKVAAGDHLGIGGTHLSAGRLIVFNGNHRNQVLGGITELVPASWNHVVLVRSDSRVRVYLNGNAAPEIEGELPSTYPELCQQWFVGGRNDNFANFQGTIDEVALYDRVVSPEEIASHFAASGAKTLTRLSESTDQARESREPVAATIEQSLKQIHVRDGFELQLVASEPQVKDPVAIDWGPDGKLWVVEMADYPLGIDGEGEPGGRVRYLQDTDGDGQYETSTLFATALPFPNGILTWGRGVLVTAAPEIVYLEDTTGDGKADLRQTLYSGFLEGNQQLRVNGLRPGLDNWVHCASGSHHAGYGKGNRITSNMNDESIQVGSRDFRIRPFQGLIDPQSGPSQYGRNRDDWGNWFGVQNSHPLWHYVLADHYIRRNPNFAPPDPRRQVVTPTNPKVYPAKSPQKRFHSFDQSGRFTSACSAMIYRDELLFPRGAEQHAFTCEPFHNLVQHNVITDDGVSFRSARDPAEAKLDFFASADRWCRPVMARTGPDGALWIVDMYRYMIEHPQWLPEKGKDELRPFYRFGDDRGRIYRIVPKGQTARNVPRLDNLSTGQLVAALESPNGWQRDTAQRTLVAKGADAAIGPLRTMSRDSQQPLARLHSLCTLDGLDALTVETLTLALDDPHPAVRRHAVRLSKGHAIDVARLIKLVDDPDAKVRLQLACSLGYSPDAKAGRALTQLAIAAAGQPYMIAAVTSSMTGSNLPHMLSAAIESRDQQDSSGEILDLLFVQTAAIGDHATIVDAIEFATSVQDRTYEPWQFSALAQMLGGLARRKWNLNDHLSEPQLAKVDQAIQRARTLIAEPTASEPIRVATAGLLMRAPDNMQSDMQLVGQLLTPQTPNRIQQAIVARVATRNEKQIAALLLDGWKAHGPRLRAEILSVVASRPSWVQSLAERLNSGDVSAAAIDAAMRQRLLATKNKPLRVRLSKAFSNASDVDRQQVVVKYQSALRLSGDTKRGAALFTKHCANCHRHAGVGHEVGPNLASITTKTPQSLLTSMLDPSAAVEAKYLNYIAITEDGRSFSGMIATETGSSITLLAAEGKRQSLLRNEIETMQSSGKSLMPDGIEKDLSPQDVADLIEFVRNLSATK